MPPTRRRKGVAQFQAGGDRECVEACDGHRQDRDVALVPITFDRPPRTIEGGAGEGTRHDHAPLPAGWEAEDGKLASAFVRATRPAAGG